MTQAETKTFQDFTRFLAEQGVTLTVPSPGDQFSLGSAAVEFLGPLENYTEVNNTSLVLRIDYGQTSFLFTGDMEKMAEQDLLEAGARLDATVLKVGHHGGDTSSSAEFLQAVGPEYAVISVGAGNSYGHPDKDAVLSRLAAVGATVYRTDKQGTVCCASERREAVTFASEESAPQSEGPTQGMLPPEMAAGYIGNASSKKFHRPTCGSLPEAAGTRSRSRPGSRRWTQAIAPAPGATRKGGPMKLLHCADLHLGKRLGCFDPLPDQRIILQEDPIYRRRRKGPGHPSGGGCV